MENSQANEVKITVIIGARIINIIVYGTGNSEHISRYFEIRREISAIQPYSEVIYLVIPTGQITTK